MFSSAVSQIGVEREYFKNIIYFEKHTCFSQQALRPASLSAPEVHGRNRVRTSGLG